MIYTEDAIRLNEAAANFHRILEAFRNDEGGPDGKDIPEAKVSAFAREAATQAATIVGYTTDALRYIRPSLADRFDGLVDAIQKIAPIRSRLNSWRDVDESALDRLADEIRRMAGHIETIERGVLSAFSE